MKGMRSLVFVLVMMFLGGIIGLGPIACKNNRQTVLDCHNDDSVEYEYVSENGDNDVYGELDTVSDEHEFPDRSSWQHLSADSTCLPGFVPYHYDATANFCEGVSYDITVDLSYDHVHKQEIDYKYLFNDDYVEQIIALLIEEAKKSPDYEKWNPDIEQYTCVKDENGKPTGQRRLPQLGLSDEGVIFSFQPYEISCFFYKRKHKYDTISLIMRFICLPLHRGFYVMMQRYIIIKV